MGAAAIAIPEQPVSYGSLPPDYVPRGEQDLRRCLGDARWRITSGQLYWIMTKENEDDEGAIIPFRPNVAQIELLDNLWYRNIILKARQLGFTTLIALLWLDHALFVSDQRCAMIAEDLNKASRIFRDKIVFAYDRLPAAVRNGCPVRKKTELEIEFQNNSSISVTVSARSGTIHRLHVSEFGKICSSHPLKAEEIITGSLPAVPLNGIAVIESTAKGQDGEFYRMTQRAKALADAKTELTQRDYRLHFYPWHRDPNYRLDPAQVVVTPTDKAYFDGAEQRLGITLSDAQRAWYIKTRDADFSGDPHKMWQEYPTDIDEPFKVAIEGAYFAFQLSRARADGRITRVPHRDGIPVNSFWDIGASDGTAIWLHQQVGALDHFIAFIEGWDKPYDWFVREMQDLGYVWGQHFLPHDAEQRRQQASSVSSPLDALSSLQPTWEFVVVPRVLELQHGIQIVRKHFGSAWFDETYCEAGIAHLGMYRKDWNQRVGAWTDRPVKDEHTEAADSFRQWAQAKEERLIRAPGGGNFRPRRRRPGGMAA